MVGRSERLTDIRAAEEAFEASLTIAERLDLPMSRLRALHELGTIDLFDHVGFERLAEARRLAEEMGALSTVATLDLQLSACWTARWDPDRCDVHAMSALQIARRLGLEQVRAKALVMLTGSASMRADHDATARLASQTIAAAPEDPMLEGFTLTSLALCELLGGDVEGAVAAYEDGMGLLARLPHAEPATNRSLWPLILARSADPRAADAIDEARRLGVTAFAPNRGLVLYAEAVLAGRSGDRGRAERIAATADSTFQHAEVWGALARLLASGPARTDRWGTPLVWHAEATEILAERGLEKVSQPTGASDPNPWAGDRITDREADVLRLVGDGLTNKEIARQLRISPRTVEKHVEHLLQKTGSTSRTQLALYVTRST